MTRFGEPGTTATDGTAHDCKPSLSVSQACPSVLLSVTTPCSVPMYIRASTFGLLLTSQDLFQDIDNCFRCLRQLGSREHLLGHVFEDVLLVFLCDGRNALDHWLEVVQHLSGRGIAVRAGARILGAEHAAVAPHDAEQQVERLLVVEDRVEIKLLQLSVEAAAGLEVPAEERSIP